MFVTAWASSSSNIAVALNINIHRHYDITVTGFRWSACDGKGEAENWIWARGQQYAGGRCCKRAGHMTIHMTIGRERVRVGPSGETSTEFGPARTIFFNV